MHLRFYEKIYLRNHQYGTQTFLREGQRVQKHEKRTFLAPKDGWGLAIELRFLFVGKLLIIRMFVLCGLLFLKTPSEIKPFHDDVENACRQADAFPPHAERFDEGRSIPCTLGGNSTLRRLVIGIMSVGITSDTVGAPLCIVYLTLSIEFQLAFIADL